MKRILITLIVLAARVNAESIMDPAVLDQKIEKSLFASDEMLSMNLGQLTDSNVSWVTDENRPLVVRKLRERYQQTGMDDPEYLEKALVRAGDWEATLKMIEDLKDPHKDTNALTLVGDKIIPNLVSVICNKSEAGLKAKKNSDAEMETQARNKALQYLSLIMSDSKALPPETVEWGGNGFPCETPEEGEDSADVISKWWEHNKEAILEKHYQDATWLPERPGPIDIAKERLQKMEREILGDLKKDKARRNDRVAASEVASEWSSAGAWGGSLPSRLAYMGIGAVIAAAGHFFGGGLVEKAA